ncbi:MAG: LLM class flavin-dependent oxidoreductase [Pseudomonadota bacterium]
MSSKKRKYWGVLSAFMPATAVAEMAAQHEAIGFEGTFAVQVHGPPFSPLSAAATSTRTLKLATGISIALTRSPFETAQAAIELDHMSEGRAVLGLGTSVKSWTNGFYGMPYDKPVARLRECVEVIQKVISQGHTGQLKNHQGEYYNLDFTELQPYSPPQRERIPIWISAMRSAMTRLGAEIADGVIGHPVWSIDWLRNQISKDLKIGLDRAGRERREIELNCWFRTTPNVDRKESIEDARAVVAFYAGMEQYEPYFAAHGFGNECKQLQEGSQQGSYMDVAHLVSDEMASTFVITGTPDEVRKRLEPAWEIADSMTLMPPVSSLPPEKAVMYSQTIAELFYG